MDVLRTLGFAGILLVLGCEAKRRGPVVPTDTSADADTDADSDTDTDSDADTDADSDADSDADTDADPWAAERALCVATINDYRATLGLPAYATWTAAQTCTDDQAVADGISGVAHSAFGSCGEFAQNECPGWPAPASGVVEPCLAGMWAEGPGSDFQAHGHYLTMSNTGYTRVACGFAVAADGSVWAIQNFQ